MKKNDHRNRIYNHEEINLEDEIDFQAGSELFSSIPKQVVEIIKKEKAFRSYHDIEFLRSAFQQFKFFKDLEVQMGQDHVTTLYKEIAYEHMLPRQVVFHLGDLGRKFYVILRGTVVVLVKKNGLADGHEDRHHRMPSKGNSAYLTQLKFQDIGDQSEEEDEQYLGFEEFMTHRFPNFMKVGEMNFGANFGEIALTKQVPRTATIVCSEDCHFATLSRETFNKMLSEYYEQIQLMNIRFLQSLSIFSDWNESILSQLYYHFVFRQAKVNEIIYKEGDKAEEIYIIREGEVEISQIVEVPMRLKSESEILAELFMNPSNGKANCKYKRMRTVVIGVGQMFGQEEVLKNVVRENQATCLSEKVSLMVLDKQVQSINQIYQRFLTYCDRGNSFEQLSDILRQQQLLRSKSISTINLIENPPYSQVNLKEKLIVDKKILGKANTNNTPKSLNTTARRFSQFALPKTKMIYDRVSDKEDLNAYKLLQGKTHLNSAIGNFKIQQDEIKKCVKKSSKVDLKNGFFNFESKGASITILNKVFPSALREKYEIPSNFGRSEKHLIRALKLPSLIEVVDKKKPLQTDRPSHLQ